MRQKGIKINYEKFAKVLGRPDSVSESGSVYWTYEGLKIRLANHEPRPTYEREFGFADADFSDQSMTRLYAFLNENGFGFEKELAAIFG